MDKAQHTPGPWTQVRRYIETDDDIVCEMFGDRLDERNANARLIAAAPDLLEALQGIIKAEQSEGQAGTGFSTKQPTREHQQRVYNAWQKAHAAIAKATGV